MFGPVFNKTFLESVFKLQEAIEQLGKNNSAGLERICFAPMASENDQPDVSNCVVQSLYGFFGNSMEEFNESEKDDSGFTVNYLNKLDDCLM